MSVENAVKTMVGELERLIATGKIIGKPIVIEDKTLIAVSKFGVGFGGGGGEGEGKAEAGKGEGKGQVTGIGGGGGITPASLIVVFKGIKGPEGVKVIPLEGPGPIGKTIGEITSTVAEALNKTKGKK